MLNCSECQQANPRTHIRYGGSGIGLFISRELTELHGGEIGLYSETGQGSELHIKTVWKAVANLNIGTFAFYIKGKRTQTPASDPIQTAQEAIDPGPKLNEGPRLLSPTLSHASQAHSKEMGRSSESSLHILLVEDNLVNQRVLSRQLTKAGCVVHVANHGQEALDFFQESVLWKGKPDGQLLDVVLMDLEMPVMDGLTCSRRIRELQAEDIIIEHVPLIAVTANARKEQIETTVAAGMVLPLIDCTSTQANVDTG